MNRRYRLRRSADFARVRQNGRLWANRFLVLAALPNDLTLSRFGFVVGKRLGGAVERNRIKRLLRETVRRNMDSIPAGWDCVLIARAPLSTPTYAQIESAACQLFRRATLGQPVERERGTMVTTGGGTGFRGQIQLV
jgi:ribonuclease P protein component